ncbi:hypothetical protein LCGC14_1182420 [marine sediment metagenome]|uniref:Uncharacterized protein n=1 Tax=marine sediment metagenome TaxID=412755 RepID=A0A0F9LRK5_9ZZZZ
MTPYNLYNTLFAIGLYETFCFLGTTEMTYVFIQDNEPRFKNRRGVLGKNGAEFWEVGLTLNV